LWAWADRWQSWAQRTGRRPACGTLEHTLHTDVCFVGDKFCHKGWRISTREKGDYFSCVLLNVHHDYQKQLKWKL
jgi:hypothetical protein